MGSVIQNTPQGEKELSDIGRINNVHQHFHSFIATRVSQLLGAVECRAVARRGEAALRLLESLSALTQELNQDKKPFLGTTHKAERAEPANPSMS